MKKLIVVDTETAGRDPHEHSILTFAAVIYQDGGISGKFIGHVQEPTLCIEGMTPEKLTPDFRFPVNNIALADVLTYDTPWLAVQKFKNWLLANELYGKQTLCAHNAAFDVGFLKRLWRLAGQDYNEQFDYRTLCTQTAALLLDQAGRISLPGGSASLDNVSALFGLARATEKHDALEDAILAARVLAKMVDRLK